MRHVRFLSLTLGAFAVLMPLSGCIISSHNENQTIGTRVDPHALHGLVAGTTTEDEMLRRLGTPSRTMPADEGGVIYVWEYEQRHESHGAVLFVFGGSTENTTQESTSVLVREGVVRSWWSG